MTTLDQQIAELVPTITADHEKQLLLKLLQALHASQTAEARLKSQQNQEALELLEKATAVDLPSCRAWHRHGLALMRLGRHEEAIPSYQKSIHLNSDTSWHWSCHDLVDCYKETGQFADGWDFFDQLTRTEQKKDWWLPWHDRGVMGYYKDTELTEATITSYRTAIELNHTHPDWIWSSEDLKGYFEKHSALERGHTTFVDLTSKKAYENYWILWHDRGWFEMQSRNRLADATESYRKAIDKHPNGGWFWSWKDLGEVYVKLNDHKKASEAFGKAIEQAPRTGHAGNEQSNVWAAWKGKANALENLGQYLDAIDAYQEAITHGHDLGELYFFLGYCREKSNHLCLAFGSYCDAITEHHEGAKQARETLLEDLQVKLWGFLNQTFDLNELKTLCFTLPGVEFDNLGGEGKSDKMRELITYQIRKDRKAYQPLRKLIAVVEKIRSDTPLP